MQPFTPSWLAAALLATPVAMAQTDALRLDTQRVSGQLFANTIAEQAFAVEVLERSDIDLLPVTNIADALEWVTGLDVRQRGSGHSVNLSIRGGGHEQTLIMIDGVRMNDPQTGHHNFNLPVVLEDIERIEVVRGPGAGQYGPNGNAGVINLVTRKAVTTESGRQAGVKLEAGSYEYLRGVLSLAKTEGKWSHFVSGQQQESDPYISGADLGYKVRQGNYRMSYQADRYNTVLGVGYLDKDFGAQGFFGTSPAARDIPSSENSIQRHAYVTHDHTVVNDQSVDLAISYRQHTDRFFYPGFAPFEHETNALQARIRYRLGESLVAGYEFNQEDIESSSIVGNEHERDYSSVFLYGSHDLGKAQLAASLSWLEYNDSDSYTLPVLGLALPLGTHQLYLNGGRSIRVPTMNDLYLNQPRNKGNPLVKPEKTTSAEIGARLNLVGVQTRIGAFVRETEDAIDFTRTQEDADNNIAYFKARNVEKIDTQGVETELDATGVLAEYGFQKATLGFTWMDHDIPNQYLDARYTKLQLVRQATLGLAYGLMDGLVLSSQYKYEERDNQEGFILWDLGLKKRYDTWHWQVGIDNALDESYIDNGSVELGSLESPGRTFRFEIAAGF